tara:strand:+ start:1148 stop:1618 length:471 start_codon:yes stop_codon:yes gene_type:complete
MIQKIKFSFLVLAIIVIQSCAVNQYQQIKTEKNYFVTFSSDIPKSFQTRVNSSLKSKENASKDNIINININSFMFKKYDVYSGSSLRALESEVKSSMKISINQNDNTKNKMLMSMKRFSSIELNPIAEEQMISFIKDEMLDDLYNQVILEVSLIDM